MPTSPSRKPDNSTKVTRPASDSDPRPHEIWGRTSENNEPAGTPVLVHQYSQSREEVRFVLCFVDDDRLTGVPQGQHGLGEATQVLGSPQGQRRPMATML